jgi:hypothetical protein
MLKRRTLVAAGGVTSAAAELVARYVSAQRITGTAQAAQAADGSESMRRRKRSYFGVDRLFGEGALFKQLFSLGGANAWRNRI